MSFIITVYTNEGIIMASDSRTTYTRTNTLPDGRIEKSIGVQTTDTTYKTFICNKRIGISTCGAADINGKPIAGYIEQFIAENANEDSSVDDISSGLLNFFSRFDPIPDVIFIVAGYNSDNQQCIKRIFVATKTIAQVDTSSAGTAWNGESEIFQKVVMPVALQQDGKYIDLPSRSIGFNFFTL